MSTFSHRIYSVRAGWLEKNPLIGRLSIPILRDSRSGTSQKSSDFRQPSLSSGSAGSMLPAFQYDADWLDHGFPIGADLQFDRSIQTPPPGKRVFGFMADRALSSRVMSIVVNDEPRDLRLKADAGPDETAALLFPHPDAAFGGLVIEEEEQSGRKTPKSGGSAVLAAKEKAERLKLRSPIRRTAELYETIYAYHAAERGKVGPSDLTYLRRALTLPGRSPVLSVLRDNEMQTARLSSLNDPIDRPLWLYIALEMARECGIPVVPSAIEHEMGDSILFQKRVDRAPEADNPEGPRVKKLPVFSAATLVSTHRPGSARPVPFSYLAMADILNREGAAPAKDLPLMWRRIVYRLMTGGAAADTPRTWLFVREPLGWRLLPAHTLEWISPAFMGALTGRDGVLPVFNRVGKGLTMDGRQTLTHPDDALRFAPYFGLSQSHAKMIMMDMMKILSDWENRVYDWQANPNDITTMAPIFDNL